VIGRNGIAARFVSSATDLTFLLGAATARARGINGLGP
jgi:hypothetical protein